MYIHNRGQSRMSISITVPCGPGTYLDNDVCTQCRNATYQDEIGQTSCKRCHKGQTTRGDGSTAVSDCKGRRF